MRIDVAVLTVLLAGLVAGIPACTPPGYGSGDDSADGSTDGAAVDAAVDAATTGDGAEAGDAGPAVPDASSAACTNTFVLADHARAGSVWLTGTFTSWATQPGAGAIEMQIDGGGVWSVSHDFAPGDYQYKFIVDSSTWITDPDAPTVDDGMGNTNSAYHCAL